MIDFLNQCVPIHHVLKFVVVIVACAARAVDVIGDHPVTLLAAVHQMSEIICTERLASKRQQ